MRPTNKPNPPYVAAIGILRAFQYMRLKLPDKRILRLSRRMICSLLSTVSSDQAPKSSVLLPSEGLGTHRRVEKERTHDHASHCTILLADQATHARKASGPPTPATTFRLEIDEHEPL